MIIHDVEQRTPEWFALRAGLPTSSEFSQLVTPGGKPSTSLGRFARSLAYAGYTKKNGSTFSGNKHTDRGNLLEPDAIADYEYITGRRVSPVGFITDDLMRYGCSTDGLVLDLNIAVEVKCLQHDGHIEACDVFDKTGGIKKDYIPQVQGEIFIPELSGVDVVFFHPDLPTLIVRQTQDDEFLAMLRSQLAAVSLERDRLISLLEAM